MQNRYVGDIGDFVKLSILRSLMAGNKLGVAWWLYPDVHNNDGLHIKYLREPAKWRRFDPVLFDTLWQIVSENRRNITSLEQADLLEGARFHNDLIPTGGPFQKRPVERFKWFDSVKKSLSGCNLIFLDPDNGLEPTGFSSGTMQSGKSVALAELSRLSEPNRTIIVYHHQTRRKGGAPEEVKFWSNRLHEVGFHTVDAIRTRPFSSRFFFVLNGSPTIRERAANLKDFWHPYFEWYADPVSNDTQPHTKRPQSIRTEIADSIADPRPSLSDAELDAHFAAKAAGAGKS